MFHAWPSTALDDDFRLLEYIKFYSSYITAQTNLLSWARRVSSRIMYACSSSATCCSACSVFFNPTTDVNISQDTICDWYTPHKFSRINTASSPNSVWQHPILNTSALKLKRMFSQIVLKYIYYERTIASNCTRHHTHRSINYIMGEKWRLPTHPPSPPSWGCNAEKRLILYGRKNHYFM